MPVSHLLDTSVFCQPLKPKPLLSVARRWRALGDEALATSVICQAEVRYGLELKQSARLNSLYEQWLEDRLQVVPIDSGIAGKFSKIKANCRRKGFSAS